jgi:hypothetical protein
LLRSLHNRPRFEIAVASNVSLAAVAAPMRAPAQCADLIGSVPPSVQSSAAQRSAGLCERDQPTVRLSAGRRKCPCARGRAAQASDRRHWQSVGCLARTKDAAGAAAASMPAGGRRERGYRRQGAREAQSCTGSDHSDWYV